MYQEREFNLQESSSVRGWECSCLAKTFHCSRNGSEKTSQLPEHCMLPLTTVIQSQPSHSASGPNLKPLYPCFCFLRSLQSSVFRIIGFAEFSVYKWIQQSWLGEKITTSTDFSWTETLFIWVTQHQVGAASIRDVWCGLGLNPVIR